jgi:hypothetical protein
LKFKTNTRIDGYITSGSVMFLDIDNYMDIVCDYSIKKECEYIFNIYNIIDKLSTRYSIKYLRSFGDGCLLLKEGRLSNQLKSSCINFLMDFNSELSKINVTFKASLCGGNFFYGTRHTNSNYQETILNGFIVNCAGISIKRCKNKQLAITWLEESKIYCYNDVINKTKRYNLNEIGKLL